MKTNLRIQICRVTSGAAWLLQSLVMIAALAEFWQLVLWRDGVNHDDGLGVAFTLLFAVMFIGFATAFQMLLGAIQGGVIFSSPLNIKLWARRHWFGLWGPQLIAACTLPIVFIAYAWIM